MKKKPFIPLIFLISLLSVILLVLFTPKTFLKGVKPETIHSISVRDGSNGNQYEITNSQDILEIVEKIQSQSFQRSGISIFHMGTSYTLSFYNSEEKEVDTFIVMDDITFRKDPFFYSTLPEIFELSKTIEQANPLLARESKTLTMEDVITLSKKGDSLSLEDFKIFKPTRTTGSGVYILIYDIDETYYLIVGSRGPELLGKPFYVKLNKNVDKDTFVDNDPSIDIRTEDMESFLKN